MHNLQFGDQITVISKTSSHKEQNGIFAGMTSNKRIGVFMFAGEPKVNLMLSSVQPKLDVHEIHFYPKAPAFVPCLLTDSFNTSKALEAKLPVIRTTQMDFLSVDLYLNGYKLFLHTDDIQTLELRVGWPVGSHKRLLPSDDLYAIWKQESQKGAL